MGHYDTPEDAYWAFFERFNAKDPEGWAGVMSYPHVRVAPAGTAMQGGLRLYPTPEDYASRASWERFEATGWVRTQGMEPVRVQESADKVHLAGGWTRFNASDKPILSNRVTYILTRLESGWGIQARFGVDSFTEGEDTSAAESAAVEVMERTIERLAAGDVAGYTQSFHFPLTVVGVGELTEVADAAELTRRKGEREPAPRKASVKPIHAGQSGVNLTIEVSGGPTEAREVILVTKRDGEWGIEAASAIAH